MAEWWTIPVNGSCRRWPYRNQSRGSPLAAIGSSRVNDAPGPLFYRRLAALGILCDLGRVFKQVPISQGLSAAFFSAGWPGTGPGKRRKIRLRAPRPPPWAGGEIAANLECLLYYIAVFLLSTHITDPSCARLMWPGHGGLFHPS